MNYYASRVLRLIKSDGADMVIHNGDFTYGQGTPAEWEAALDLYLGSDFPYFGSVGNHEPYPPAHATTLLRGAYT